MPRLTPQQAAEAAGRDYLAALHAGNFTLLWAASARCRDAGRSAALVLALERCGGNLTHAAEACEIPLRTAQHLVKSDPRLHAARAALKPTG